MDNNDKLNTVEEHELDVVTGGSGDDDNKCWFKQHWSVANEFPKDAAIGSELWIACTESCFVGFKRCPCHGKDHCRDKKHKSVVKADGRPHLVH